MERFTFGVRLKPRAGKESITAAGANELNVCVKTPPVDNKANEALIALVAKWLGFPKSSFAIIKGGHSRNKVLACEGLSEELFRTRLEELATGSGKMR